MMSDLAHRAHGYFMAASSTKHRWGAAWRARPPRDGSPAESSLPVFSFRFRSPAYVVGRKLTGNW
jgi:hypothetical protein